MVDGYYGDRRFRLPMAMVCLSMSALDG